MNRGDLKYDTINARLVYLVDTAADASDGMHPHSTWWLVNADGPVYDEGAYYADPADLAEPPYGDGADDAYDAEVEA